MGRHRDLGGRPHDVWVTETPAVNQRTGFSPLGLILLLLGDGMLTAVKGGTVKIDILHYAP